MILSWDDEFLALAQVVALRSKDPCTQVGAVIVNHDHRILSLGYNGTPNGIPDTRFQWGKGDPDPTRNKTLRVIHAERNAILNYRGLLRDMTGATLYVTLYPCCECVKSIVQVGITRVVYGRLHGDERTTPGGIVAGETLSDCGVEVVHGSQSGKKIILSL